MSDEVGNNKNERVKKLNRKKGLSYEQQAAEYLTAQGYRIVEKNYRGGQGEIDLIARESGYLVFIEVKGRRSGQNGDPSEAVGYAKQRKICRTARWYLMEKRWGESTPCRFDVVTILGSDIRVIRHAFEM